MTTIVGIKAYGGNKPAVVMATDFQTTKEFYRSGTDAIYKILEKGESQKLMIDDKRQLVFSMTGTVNTPPVNKFTRRLLGSLGDDKIKDIERKLKRGYVPEFREMNMKNCIDGRSLNDKRQCSALIGSRFDNDPNLYFIAPMGQATDNRKKDMPETFYISIGSGSEYALKLLDSELKDLKVIDPKNAIELASWAVREATRNDIYSAGSDLVVITSEEIQQFGRQIKDASDEAVRQVLSDIVDKFQ
jgi:hypothetical protein